MFGRIFLHRPTRSVYCSQAFAAISETLSVKQYECSYVGNVPLAKGYGLQPVYHLRWGNSPAGRQLQGVLADKQRAIMPDLPPLSALSQPLL
jgi:hypothetical protein